MKLIIKISLAAAAALVVLTSFGAAEENSRLVVRDVGKDQRIITYQVTVPTIALYTGQGSASERTSPSRIVLESRSDAHGNVHRIYVRKGCCD